MLRAADGRAVAAARPLFPHAHDRLFRGRARLAWRCADSFSLRDFLRLSNVEKVPDHSWLSRTRSRLPHEAHEKVFGWVLKLVAERGLVKGERIGVDGSTMEANAALRTIVRHDTGESYRAMLARMAQESGIETPTAEDLARFDRKRKGKTLSNADWKSPTDRDARIAKMKDGTTHLAHMGRSESRGNSGDNGRHLRRRLDRRSEPAPVDGSHGQIRVKGKLWGQRSTPSSSARSTKRASAG